MADERDNHAQGCKSPQTDGGAYFPGGSVAQAQGGGEPGVETGGKESNQAAANVGKAAEDAVVVDGKAEDLVEELRKKKRCMGCGPRAANVSKYDAPHWPTAQDITKRNVSHSGSDYRCIGFSHQEILLFSRYHLAI